MTLQLRPGTLIERGRLWTIALNSNQNLLGKCFILLNRPCRVVTEVEPDEWSDLFRQISRVKLALDSLFAPDQYNYAFLMNLDPQLHLQVIPRYKSARRWDERTYHDPNFGCLFGNEKREFSAQESERLSRAISSRLPVET